MPPSVVGPFLHSPPCIVLGLETQIGLNIVRELGRAGVPVIGIAHTASAIGLKSKYLHRGLVVHNPRSPELVQTIQLIGGEFGSCPLLTVSEVNMLWLAEHRNAMAPVFPVLPDPRALATVLDKSATLSAAAASGIDIPRTWQPMSHDDIAPLLREVSLPAILKWSDPNAIAPLLATHRLPLLKAEYVNSVIELRSALSRYHEVGAWPLIQEYCAGYGLGQFFYMKNGHAVRTFQHRRVAEWPPEGGFSSVCDALPLSEHADSQQRSIELLRRIGWSGLAMVEYRYDPKLRKARLMEINGRFWGSFPLAFYCGAAFALLAYLDATGKPLDQLAAPTADLRCRMVATEIKRLVRIVGQPGKIADRSFVCRPWHEMGRFFFDFLRPRVRYYVWSTDDPMPFITDMRNLAHRTT